MRYFILFFSSFLHSNNKFFDFLYSNNTVNEVGKSLKGLFYDDLRLINISCNAFELYCFELCVNGVYNVKSNNKNDDDSSILKRIDAYIGLNVNLFIFHSVGFFVLFYDSVAKNFCSKEKFFVRLQYQFLFGRFVLRLFYNINFLNNSISWNDKFIGFSLGYFVHDKVSISVSSKLHGSKALQFLDLNKNKENN